MWQMFKGAKSFKSDISKWDVSKVTDMTEMFKEAVSFDFDISKWDVSKVTDMRRMFSGANSFNHTLCGEAWVNANAPHSYVDTTDMFDDSLGSISRTICGLWSILIILIFISYFFYPVSSSSQL